MISYVDFFTEFVYPKTQEIASTAIAGVESKENERFLYSLGRTAGEGMESYSIQVTWTRLLSTLIILL